MTHTTVQHCYVVYITCLLCLYTKRVTTARTKPYSIYIGQVLHTTSSQRETYSNDDDDRNFNRTFAQSQGAICSVKLSKIILHPHACYTMWNLGKWWKYASVKLHYFVCANFKALSFKILGNVVYAHNNIIKTLNRLILDHTSKTRHLRENVGNISNFHSCI